MTTLANSDQEYEVKNKNVINDERILPKQKSATNKRAAMQHKEISFDLK